MLKAIEYYNYYFLINVYSKAKQLLGFLCQKTLCIFLDPCSPLPRTANILNHLEISCFGPIFKSSPSLAINAHILVKQAELISGLLFPLRPSSHAVPLVCHTKYN